MYHLEEERGEGLVWEEPLTQEGWGKADQKPHAQVPCWRSNMSCWMGLLPAPMVLCHRLGAVRGSRTLVKIWGTQGIAAAAVSQLCCLQQESEAEGFCIFAI